MTITELIANLQPILEEHGDLDIEVRNWAGDWDVLSELDVMLPHPSWISNRTHLYFDV